MYRISYVIARNPKGVTWQSPGGMCRIATLYREIATVALLPRDDIPKNKESNQ